MVGLIEEAWAARRPGGVALAHEYAAVAFNRRPQFLVNGKRESKMYGDCSEPNFLGYEGPSDHSADMLYTFDEQRQLTGALVCIPCPSQVYELHRFISADYWGEVRTQLRAELGNIYVLPLCGAALRAESVDVKCVSLRRAAIAVGNEGRGLTDALLEKCDTKIILPMTPSSESLNAAVAASILMWEMWTQRG